MAQLISENSNSLVSIVPFRVADNNGKASVLNTYLGIKKAMELGVGVINISMNASVSATSQMITQVIDEATAIGILVVVSAGNLGLDTASVCPANVGSAIVVSATADNNEFAGYSNYGSSVDYSAYGSYNGKTGTSYATARVSGIIADMLSKQGNLGTLDDYAIDLGTEGRDSQFGKGLISKETISNDEESGDEIIKKNKEVYENLCKNWKTLPDKELNSLIQSTSDEVLSYFLKSLSEEELKELISKDTDLNKNRQTVTFDKDMKCLSDTEVVYYKYLLETNFSTRKNNVRTTTVISMLSIA